MQALVQLLNGKKTHILATAYGVMAALRLTGVELDVDVDALFADVEKLLLAGIAICLRLGIAKSGR